MKIKALLAIGLLTTIAVTASAQTTIFSDDFESGNMNNWTAGNTYGGMSVDNTVNVVPVGGTWSLKSTLSAGRVYHNLGTELGGASSFTSWIYDDTMTRSYAQVLSYSGAGYNQGTLDQLLAIGKYNSVTMPGEVLNASKYQARIALGTGAGWFNLDAAGSPDRSTGWHKFTIDRSADNNTLNFYVDDILSRSFSGFSAPTWDSLTLGFGTSSTSNGNTWYDGVSVVSIPEPSSIGLSLLGGLGLLGWIIRRRKV